MSAQTANAQAEVDAPVPQFDWTMPDRYVVPVPDDVGGSVYLDDGAASLDPSGWPVTFDSCADPTPSPNVTYEWQIPGLASQSRSDCIWTFEFPAEGVYDVSLTVRDSTTGEVRGSTTQPVTVQDWLIVSLGDSIASGEGNPDVRSRTFSKERWQDERCHRSSLAGPALAAAELERIDPRTSVTFVHLACSGASIEHGLLGFDDGQDPPTPRNIPPQLTRLNELRGDREIDAVVASVGANEVDLTGLLEECAGLFALNCDRDPDIALRFERGVAALPGWYDDLAACIAPPDTEPGICWDAGTLNQPVAVPVFAVPVEAERVYLTEYPDPMRDGNGGVCDGLNGVLWGLIDRDEATWASEMVLPRINQAGADSAVAHGWQHIDGLNGTSLFGTHGYCASQSWIRSFPQSLIFQRDPVGTIHPNELGHQAYGDRILEDLRQDLFVGGDLGRPRPPAGTPAPPLPNLVCNGLAATIVGTAGDDVLTGTPAGDVIVGLGGNDAISSGDGNDTICAGDGNDRVWSGNGADWIDGGAGRDRLRGGRQADTILGGDNGDKIWGNTGADEIDGQRGNDRLIGNRGDDVLSGGNGRIDVLDGRGGTDRCIDAQPTTVRISCES